jgi:rhodanese-related sulfurtransferase
MNIQGHLHTWIYAAVVASALTAALIYLTPLKWIAVIEPSIHDVDARAFSSELSADPEKYVFIDVRPEAAYTAKHAAGSVSMPLHTLYDTRHTLPRTGKEIVLICSGGRASGVGYSYLQHYGFSNIRRIEGGIEQWEAAGLPIEGETVTAM